MNKPKLGDKLFLVDTENRSRFHREKRHCEVTKVGRKYFTVSWSDDTWEREAEFVIETFRQKTEYSDDFTLYESEQEWADSVECRKCVDAIRKAFSYGVRKDLTVDQLREVVKILGLSISTEEK